MYRYYFEIAGLGICIESPVKISFQPCMLPFQSGEERQSDLIYRLELSNKILVGEERIYIKDFSVFMENNHYVRLRNLRLEQKTITIMLRKVKEDCYEMRLPIEMQTEQVLFKGGNILNFLALEEPLLEQQAFLLHSSFISWNGKGILFTAPSGTGKSTQAELWKEFENAEIYNGDRTILRKIDNKFIGFGSPYAGSSGIYRNESAPIKAIIVLSQAKENRIQKLSGKQAFLPLYKETLMNTWNKKYMDQMVDLLMEAAELIPVYHLACRPDKEAVMLVKRTILTL